MSAPTSRPYRTRSPPEGAPANAIPGFVVSKVAADGKGFIDVAEVYKVCKACVEADCHNVLGFGVLPNDIVFNPCTELEISFRSCTEWLLDLPKFSFDVKKPDIRMTKQMYIFKTIFQ
jgi:hypothetical protein